MIAYIPPCGISIYLAETENFNPSDAGCWLAKAPLGCEANPDIPCERGEPILRSSSILWGLSSYSFTLSCQHVPLDHCIVGSVNCRLRWLWGSRNASYSRMCTEENDAKYITSDIYYLFSFWFTFLFTAVNNALKL